MYCAYTANAFSESKSFNDFLEENNKKTETADSGEPLDDAPPTDKQAAFQIVQSQKILKGFTPPTKGG